MAKRLKLRTVAEGVETQAQLEFLRANGCDTYQGYLFAKPLTALEVTAMFKTQRVAA
jgi:EAL domain-containing protein (putative c-di-GMP-specific phosphodiesterase class I)